MSLGRKRTILGKFECESSRQGSPNGICIAVSKSRSEDGGLSSWTEKIPSSSLLAGNIVLEMQRYLPTDEMHVLQERAGVLQDQAGQRGMSALSRWRCRRRCLGLADTLYYAL